MGLEPIRTAGTVQRLDSLASRPYLVETVGDDPTWAKVQTSPAPQRAVPLFWCSRKELNLGPPGFNRLLYQLSYNCINSGASGGIRTPGVEYLVTKEVQSTIYATLACILALPVGLEPTFSSSYLSRRS